MGFFILKLGDTVSFSAIAVVLALEEYQNSRTSVSMYISCSYRLGLLRW